MKTAAVETTNAAVRTKRGGCPRASRLLQDLIAEKERSLILVEYESVLKAVNYSIEHGVRIAMERLLSGMFINS